MNKFSKELIKSLTEAWEHAEGKPGGVVRVHGVEVPDVRAVRGQLHSAASRTSGGRPAMTRTQTTKDKRLNAYHLYYLVPLICSSNFCEYLR
jgi:hypothetical protein